MNLDHLHGEALFAELRKNNTSIIQSKKATLKFTDSIVSNVNISPREVKPSGEVSKEDSLSSDPLPASGTIDVTVVCNSAWFCDSHMDVLTDKAYDESIAQRGNTIPHIKDHIQSSTAHVGDVTKVYTKKVSLRDLGLDQDGSTTALLMETTIRKDYNEDVFKFYSNGKINQHSVGLTYGDLALAMNSEDEADIAYKAVWDKHYKNIINKDVVDKRGYFYIVPKVDIRENSCVLFGANPLTPTLAAKGELMALPNSSLGNKEENVLTQPSIGVTMTLEEAQGKIISLTEELATAKAAITVAKLEATVNEKNRVLNILKAQATFGSEANLQKAALTFIEKGLDTEIAITSFEVIKEANQGANPVDTSVEGLKASLKKSDFPSTFTETLDKALEQVGASVNYFEGVK